MMTPFEINQFHSPSVDPYYIPKRVGVYNVHSKYIPNDYYVNWTPAKWREAIDLAQNASDFTLLDTMYSWCVESSPFLLSQINKRLVPMSKRRYALADRNTGEIDEYLTKIVVNTRWHEKLKRSRLLSKFYGIKVIGIDILNDILVDYPLRNIDAVNKGLRYMTYDIDSIVNVGEYDNLFWLQPESDQDYRLGMLMPISRALIGTVESFNLWNIANKQYSYPRQFVGYIDGNAEMKQVAEEIAQKASDPSAVFTIPFRQNLKDQENIYQIEIKPVQTQSYADSFRGYKEYIDKYQAEIMQLVTGGTLLGATEKNTNSEQLASIHMSLYEDICNDDDRDFRDFMNKEGALVKISRLYGIPRIADLELIEVPDQTMTLQEFEAVSQSLSRMGMRMKPEALSNLGLDPNLVDTSRNHQSWVTEIVEEETLSSKFKNIFHGKRQHSKSTPADNSGS